LAKLFLYTNFAILAQSWWIHHYSAIFFVEECFFLYMIKNQIDNYIFQKSRNVK